MSENKKNKKDFEKLNKIIAEYGIAKENCYNLLENPSGLINGESLTFWASRVEFLLKHIKKIL